LRVKLDRSAGMAAARAWQKMVAMAMDRAHGRLVEAKIKPDNIASQQIVRNLGFTKTMDRGGVGVWVYDHKDARP
jgi:RimJ/RimL family protein N-acetyltransferase